MCVIEIKLFITLSVLWSCSRSELVKPRILLANGTESNSDIFMLHGEPLELYCTGQEGHELQISGKSVYFGHTSDEFKSTSVNKTTIRLYAERPDEDILQYQCHYKNYTKYGKKAYLIVHVRSIPAVQDFRCISMNLEYLNCSWTSIARFNGYPTECQLYYVKDGMPKHLCTTFARFNDSTAYYVWDGNHIFPYTWYGKHLAFSMKSCNEVACANQTFEFDHRAIIKMKAPTLELQSKSSYGVVLRLCDDLYPDLKLESKISYWYAGIPSFHNYSNTIFKTSTDSWYFEEMKLPCASELYEVRVSLRLQLSVGEEFWSDDGVIRFVTEPAPEDVGTAVDPTCNQPRSKVTREVILYLIDELFKKIKEEQNELKMKINSLKLKAGYKL